MEPGDLLFEAESKTQHELILGHTKICELSDKLRTTGIIQSIDDQLTTKDLLEWFTDNQFELLPIDYLVNPETKGRFADEAEELMSQAAYELIKARCEHLGDWE